MKKDFEMPALEVKKLAAGDGGDIPDISLGWQDIPGGDPWENP